MKHNHSHFFSLAQGEATSLSHHLIICDWMKVHYLTTDSAFGAVILIPMAAQGFTQVPLVPAVPVLPKVGCLCVRSGYFPMVTMTNVTMALVVATGTDGSQWTLNDFSAAKSTTDFNSTIGRLSVTHDTLINTRTYIITSFYHSHFLCACYIFHAYLYAKYLLNLVIRTQCDLDLLFRAYVYLGCSCCPTGWVKFEENCYWFERSRKLNWQSAKVRRLST